MEDPSLPGVQTERPNPSVDSAYDYKLPRRLVVCLDGTWNKRDSGTNVYHISNLIQEGRVKDENTQTEWFQVIYYDEGVGTGILDGMTGGAFGLGLSENIREAYDWLVEKYREGSDSRPDDEIYIFGFSRGAFTARSLIGLIAKCGLLQRGAPIPPAQLWEAYRILGRHQNPRTGSIPAANWWERIRGRPKQPFRLIRGLQRDKWEEPDADPPIKNAVYRTEHLLVQWSRRVKINCVGIFDTVGSMGLDALAIPWLRDKIAQFHDTYLSTLIVNGFHALAIDEHRANFPHIPWHRELTSASGKTPGGGNVEQVWFIGAHSNIGGGYEDGMLARFPLAWMIQKCSALGLQFRKPLAGAPDPTVAPVLSKDSPIPDYPPLLQRVSGEFGMSNQLPQVRDSFAEIARGIWRGLIRAKREYRRIGPPPEFQNGIRAQSANESVDPSVSKLILKEYARPGRYTRYNSPNLWEYWARTKKFEGTMPTGYTEPGHQYFEKNFAFWGWLGGWLLGVAGAAAAVARMNDVHGCALLWPALAAMGCGFLLDYWESAMNNAVTLEPDGVRAERRNALLTLAVFFRLIILCAILFGVFYWLVWAWPWLLRLDHSGHLWWLLILDGLLIYCSATAGWCASPMEEAGFGSILGLQSRRNAKLVSEWLNKWGGSEGTDPERRQWLMPIAHTIYRDIFAYIPAYAIALLVGNCAALWCLPSDLALREDFLGLLVRNWPTWSLYFILSCVVADLVEDAMHLYYIKKYPQPPSSPAVLLGFSATVIKFVCLAIPSIGFLVAIICLAWHQINLLWARQTGGLSVLVLVLTALLFFPAVKGFVTSLRKKADGNGSA